MVIIISRGLRISTDPNNFTVQKRMVVAKGKREGEVYWSDVGFYPTLQSAAQACITKALANADQTVTLQEVIAKVERMGARIAEACELAGKASQMAELEGEAGDPGETELEEE
jgi:hypothetical protein